VAEPSPNDNRERRFGPGNNLRIDLYRALISEIQEQDQRSEHIGPALHWNDPNAAWNGGGVLDVWNAIGLAPVYQTLFYVLETLQGEEVAVLESMDALVDPFECPAEVLADIAASFGYRLKEDLSEEMKRIVVQGLLHAYKSLGQFAGFKCFYRMVGFEIIRIFPLWKKDIQEERSDYSRVRYDTTPVVAEPVGLAGTQAFATNLSGNPVKPGTVRIADGGTVVVRDEPTEYQPEGLTLEPTGVLISAAGEVGTINYQTGAITLDLGAPAVGAVTADYEQIDEEWPYHAARLDIEILMNPGGVPIPLSDEEVFQDILTRMDEVRPIHVLLRAITLAFEISDTLSPGATDFTACTQTLKDLRDGYPLGFEPGLNGTYMLDQSPAPEDSGLSIEKITAGVTTEYRQELEDRTGFVCPLKDVLIVDTGGASGADGYY
jgi:hypothetical protein